MAFTIGDLGNDSGYVYIRLKTGAINTLDNKAANVMGIMLDAVKSRLIYTKYTLDNAGAFTDQFQDNDWGTRYYLNAEVAAPYGDLTGALDITKYVIDAQKCYKDQVTIASGEATVTRYSFFHLVIVTPESGTLDTLNKLNNDFQPGDLVFITLADDATDTIIINPHTVDSGNFKCQNNEGIILSGPGSCAFFIKDANAWPDFGGNGYLREVGRPNQQALGIANKTLTSGGGNYYPLDVSTSSGARIDTKQGLIVLAGGATLAAPWNIFGEMVDSERSVGTALEFILDAPLITSAASGNTLNIFGIQIPDTYCEDYNFVVKAWYDGTEWHSRMYVDQLKGDYRPLFGDGTGSGETEPVSTINALEISVDASAAIKTISHAEGTEGLVSLSGVVILTNGLTYTDPGVVLGSSIIPTWRPTASYETTFVCAVHRGGLFNGFCILNIYDDITLYAVQGYDLAPGDQVCFSNVVYPATR
jgi:hypothetical protein